MAFGGDKTMHYGGRQQHSGQARGQEQQRIV